MPDLRALFEDAQPQRVPAPDLDTIEQRATRRHRTRQAAAVLAAVAAVAVIIPQVSGGGVPVIEQPSPQPATEATPTPTPSAEPTGGDAGPAGMEEPGWEAFPAVAEEGIAVQTSDGVVLIGLDGTVLEQVPEVALDSGGMTADGWAFADEVPGLLAVKRLSDGAALWADARNGGVLKRSLGIPLSYDTLLVPSDGPASPWVLDQGNEFYAVEAHWSGRHRLSAGHRVLSWTDCAATANPSDCGPVRVVDFDIGGVGTTEHGCWVSDKFADFNTITTCFQSGEPRRSWLELRSTDPSQTVRIDMPLHDGAPLPTGHYTKAFFGGPGIVAELGLECETRRVVGIDGDEVVGLFGPRWDDGPNASLLGVSRDSPFPGRPILQITEGACGSSDLDPGVYILEEDGSLTSLTGAQSFTDVQMWSLAPSIPAIHERLGESS